MAPVAAPVSTRGLNETFFNETEAPIAAPVSRRSLNETYAPVTPVNFTDAPIAAPTSKRGTVTQLQPTYAPVVPPVSSPTAAPTDPPADDDRTCPTNISGFYQNRGHDVVPCKTNADCEGFVPADGLEPCW